MTLKPEYTTPDINSPICLYKGSLKLHDCSGESPGEGAVNFVWFPKPQIKFEFKVDPEHRERLIRSAQEDLKKSRGEIENLDLSRCTPVNPTDLFGNASITLSSNPESYIPVLPTRSYHGDASGIVTESIQQIIGSRQCSELSYILFHIVNFDLKLIDKENPLILRAEDWQITLGALTTTEKHCDVLKNEGGFAITHVGRLEKVNGQHFSGEDVVDFLDTVSYFLSFARGFQIPIILPVGYNLNGEKCWEYWGRRSATAWHGVSSWFPTDQSQILAEIFPGFLQWWRDWGDPARVALTWYLESCSREGFVEEAVVLTQVALELSS